MKTKTIASLLVIALLAVLTVGCSVVEAIRNDLEIVGGSGNMISRTFDEKDFTEVVTGHGAILNITAADDYSVMVDMDENIEPYLEVTNTGGRLSILLNDDQRIYTNTRLNIAITMPELRGLDLSGGTIGTVTGFGSEQPLNVELSGGSQLRGDINSGNAGVDISGGSKIDLAGSGGDLDLNATGGSFVHLGGFLVRNVNLDVSGGGEVEIHPSGVIQGQASGGTMVHYEGDPTSVEVDTNGGAEISHN